MKKIFVRLLGTSALLLFSLTNSFGWDYEGHRAVNQLALATLPANFPAFVKTPAAMERIAFLAGEPDRWRNTPDLSLKHYNGPDHYIDLEELALCDLKAETLPVFRYDFVAAVAKAQAAHPERFPAVDPAKNEDHTRQLVGYLPWAITENYAKLKSEFSYLKTFQAYGGTPEEIANAQANVLYTMGVMGHYVGDGSQPLHSTIHHHGWVGENPHGYPTNSSFHGWIDGGYFKKIGGIKVETLAAKIKPAQRVGNPAQPDGFFRAVMAYLVAQHKLLEPLYQLEKDHKLSPRDGEEVNLEGKTFLEGQLIKGGQMMGDIWFTAWQEATEDKYLKGELQKRNAAQAATEKKE